MRIKLPASITDATLDLRAGDEQHHDHPIRNDVRATGRANASRRPTAAPRRSSY
ncbi:MAG: hypothetical protein HOY71_28495 [Nonomuraea sp.]|nr:hypothetical protein [Nonomuraea sp.]